MKLLCLSCSREMSRIELPRITFNCAPCRETTHFFHLRADRDFPQRFFAAPDCDGGLPEHLMPATLIATKPGCGFRAF
jgi:hypothetical protein